MGRSHQKKVATPKRYSEALAEIVGIILGDGNIYEYVRPAKQYWVYSPRIAFHSAEQQYQEHVKQQMADLFCLEPHTNKHSTQAETIQTYVGKELVEYLKSIGLRSGSKTAHEASVPDWVYSNTSYMRACLRGLMDTDGSIYRMGRWHQICFKNKSCALLKDFQRLSRNLGMYCSKITCSKVYISRKEDVRKFFNEVGVHNEKHERRYRAIVSPMV